MNRSNCAICNNRLIQLYKLDNIPITFSPPKDAFENDKSSHQIYSYCEECGCVQLSNLINPEILYNTTHNITYSTPTWQKHHIDFSEFILDKIKDINTLTEIGGMSGVLSKHIIKSRPDIKYTCIDLCDITEDSLEGITFIKGNCEDCSFEGTHTIAMSHVFEHLYNPSKFVENIAKYNVKSVIISIPNLEELLNNKNLNTLHFEHTYYIDKYYIEYMFSKHGYKLNDINYFGKHSIFFHFIKEDHKELDLINNTELKYKFNDLLTIRNNIANIKIEPNSFIAPGGHFGQLIYTLCKPHNLLGFLDNDTSKQGYRVYGTPYIANSYSKLLEYENVNVYVYAGPYTDEIVKQLEKYKVNIFKISDI
jgi:hypothetical protein